MPIDDEALFALECVKGDVMEKTVRDDDEVLGTLKLERLEQPLVQVAKRADDLSRRAFLQPTAHLRAVLELGELKLEELVERLDFPLVAEVTDREPIVIENERLDATTRNEILEQHIARGERGTDLRASRA